MYDEGLTEAFSGNGDMKANVAKVISAAEMGLAEAQTGYVALRNLGLVKLTESEVFKWCFLAAKQGLRAAQTKIGVMYY